MTIVNTVAAVKVLIFASISEYLKLSQRKFLSLLKSLQLTSEPPITFCVQTK